MNRVTEGLINHTCMHGVDKVLEAKQRPNSPPSPVAKRAGDVTIGNMGGNFRFGSLSLRHKGLYSMEYSGTVSCKRMALF